MAGGGGGGSGGGGNMLQSLIKPMATGRGDPLGLVPELPNRPSSLDPMAELPTMQTPQTTDRLAFLRAFGVQG